MQDDVLNQERIEDAGSQRRQSPSINHARTSIQADALYASMVREDARESHSKPKPHAKRKGFHYSRSSSGGSFSVLEDIGQLPPFPSSMCEGGETRFSKSASAPYTLRLKGGARSQPSSDSKDDMYEDQRNDGEQSSSTYDNGDAAAERTRSPSTSSTRNSSLASGAEVRLYVCRTHRRSVCRTDFVLVDDGMHGGCHVVIVDAIMKAMLRVALIDERWVMLTTALKG